MIVSLAAFIQVRCHPSGKGRSLKYQSTAYSVETKAGHGGGKPTAKIIEENADAYAFMFYNLGVTAKVIRGWRLSFSQGRPIGRPFLHRFIKLFHLQE